MRKICIIGASGKLGQHMVQACLDRGMAVNAVCRPGSVAKLDRFAGRITCYPGRTDDPAAVGPAVARCDGVLVVLAPWGMKRYATGTAQAALDLAAPDARLVFSCGWHIRRDVQDRYTWRFLAMVAIFRLIGRLLRVADLDDQVEATRRIFDSGRAWTVVRGSDLEEGPSQGLPRWSHHIGDPLLASNLTRRIDFAAFMVHALEDPELLQQAPAIVGCDSASARAHAPGP